MTTMPKKPGKDFRQQLVEARNTLSRQIEILRAPMGGSFKTAPPDNRALIAELSRQIQQIDEALGGG